MAAFACLRILLHPPRLEKPGGEGVLLASRIATSFLEAHWAYPKRAAQISPASFQLTDPLESTISPERLQPLAAALQRQFFGAGDSGEASLILFAGPQDEMARCAIFPNAELRMLINGELGPLKTLLKASVWKINARNIVSLQAAPTAPPAEKPSEEMLPCFRGIFLTAKQEFIGNVASRWRADDHRHTSVLDGPSHFPGEHAARFDKETAQTCALAIERNGRLPGLLYVPLCYTNLVKRTERGAYAGFFQILEKLPKLQLTAMLYDVPRDPFYAAIGDVTSFLHERFGAVDLLVADPGFNLGSLSQAKVRSISLCLPNTEDALRQSAIKRFAGNRDEFRRKQILPMLSNVRTVGEITLSMNLKIPLVSGKAVTDILSKPLDMFPYMTEALPLIDPAPG